MRTKRFLPILILAAWAGSLVSELQAATSQERGRLLTRVVDTLEKSFHDEEFREGIPDLAAPFRQKAKDARTLQEERMVVHEFLSLIPSSHLAIYSKYSHGLMERELANRDTATFGFQLQELDDGFYVSSVFEGGPAARAGLMRGDKIRKINDSFTGDSPRLDWRTDDAAMPDPPTHIVMGEEGDLITLVVARQANTDMSLQIRADEYSTWRAAKASSRVIARHGKRFGYIHFWLFHFRGMTSLLQDKTEGQFADCDGLILDMRGRGGSATAVKMLTNILTGEDSIWDKPLVVLVDSNTRSAKEVFAYEVQRQKIGTVVGEKTAGAVIPATFKNVGDDTVLMFPSFQLGNYTYKLEAQGVTPDVLAVDRLPFSAGADPILEAGVKTMLRLTGIESSMVKPTKEPGSETALGKFRKQHNYRDPRSWMSLDVLPSVITETRRRIYFNKEAATQALLQNDGGVGFDAAPMKYADGTAFVAESLDEECRPLETAVLIVRSGAQPDFKLFDAAGNVKDTFCPPNAPPEGPQPGNVPEACLGCHMGEEYFDPMKSFPSEPEGRRVILESRYRDSEVITQYLESYHRGDHLFGPYASIWLSKLKADSHTRNKDKADNQYFKKLKRKYPDFLTPD